MRSMHIDKSIKWLRLISWRQVDFQSINSEYSPELIGVLKGSPFFSQGRVIGRSITWPRYVDGRAHSHQSADWSLTLWRHRCVMEPVTMATGSRIPSWIWCQLVEGWPTLICIIGSASLLQRKWANLKIKVTSSDHLHKRLHPRQRNCNQLTLKKGQ